ncbi:MAG: hypothetical protein P9X27_03590 [Candidatus Kaelpia aquatica]|nr:hypothetical protein [Candidatus Kaelpia aquatica]
MGFKDFPDMMKLAQEAKNVQREQEEGQKKQIEALGRIEQILAEILLELRKK